MKKATFEELELCLAHLYNDRVDFKSNKEADELAQITSDLIKVFGWTEEEYFTAFVSNRDAN